MRRVLWRRGGRKENVWLNWGLAQAQLVIMEMYASPPIKIALLFAPISSLGSSLKSCPQNAGYARSGKDACSALA
jgi:hypothetical protein